TVRVTSDLALAARADIVLIATPAQSVRAAVSALAPHLAGGKPVIVSAKGIERGTHKFMTEVIAETAPAALRAILSAPSFVETAAGRSEAGNRSPAGSNPERRTLALGTAPGRGKQPPRDRLAEGEFTAPVLAELAASQSVDMPVSNAVAAILSGAVSIDAAIE